ncbi:MAG TPA: hypothetical protein VHX88_06695 [Solirubrobacteraceae bacterium]|nr:hypothetical protein [Solirubrobacteraceae bacterium]
MAGAVLAVGAPWAHADADPASDVLLVQDVFYPYEPATPTALENALQRALKEIHATGLPLRVAIIESPIDLGGIPALFGQPARYAHFLEGEIDFNTRVPLLVVTPQGLAVQDAVPASDLAGVPMDVDHQSAGLARTAVRAVERIAAARGRPIAPPPLPASDSGATGGNDAPAFAFAVPATLFILGGCVLALRRSGRRRAGQDEDDAGPHDRPVDGEPLERHELAARER